MAKLFDDLTDIYDAMVDWPRRLANEEPFYRRIFDQIKAARVVDVACGTGRHAAMFYGWNLSVEGADLSAKMIERARSNFDAADDLRWVVRGFDEPIACDAPYDAAVCVGNSLSLAPDLATVDRALAEMLAAVRPGGVVIIHVMNLWRLPDGPCVWQKCLRANLGQGNVLILKGVHRSCARGFVELIVMSLDGAILTREAVPFLGLESTELEQMALRAGAASIECYGSYQSQPYDRRESVDLLMVMRK